MHQFNLRYLWLPCYLVATCFTPLMAEIWVTNDKDNVVSSRLVGTWTLSIELNRRLDGADQPVTIFREDARVAKKVPDKFQEYLRDKRIYMAGTMERGDRTFPFLLIESNGNSVVMYFRDLKGDPLGDCEFRIVSLATARDSKNDILFVGHDFNGPPMTAFERMEAP